MSFIINFHSVYLLQLFINSIFIILIQFIYCNYLFYAIYLFQLYISQLFIDLFMFITYMYKSWGVEIPPQKVSRLNTAIRG